MPARISMTKKQREALLALPETEEEVVRHYTLSADDLATIGKSRTPETRLSFALQLCCLRYPGRNLQRGEFLPPVMLDYIAEQIDADTAAITRFARRGATRYEQLAAIRRHHGFREFTRPARTQLAAWAAQEAVGLTEGRDLLERLIARMRNERIIIPGISVIERLAATAMHAVDLRTANRISTTFSDDDRRRFDALLSAKTHARQTSLSWLREPPSRVGGRPLLEILDKIATIRQATHGIAKPDTAFAARLAKMAKEGLLYTSQAFQQMGAPRRYTVMLATLADLEVTLTDAALSMFQALVGRANLRARKRLEETIAISAEQGRLRLTRIADVLQTLASSAKAGSDIKTSIEKITSFDIIEEDVAVIRRTLRPGRPDIIGELRHEHAVFRQIGARFLLSFTFEGNAASSPLLEAVSLVAAMGGDRRKRLLGRPPITHIERRWRRHVFKEGGIDRTYYELATYFALSSALASGDVWVPTSRIHQSLDAILSSGRRDAPIFLPS